MMSLLEIENHKEDHRNKAMPKDDDEAPSPQIHLSLTPSDLKKDAAFQDSYAGCKAKLQNMILWWQRLEAIRLKGKYEEIGRSVEMSEQMMKLLEDCSGNSTNQKNTDKKEKPKLHNQHY